LGRDVELYGCDVFPPGDFPHFHAYAGLEYHQLDHPYRLPYEDSSFDMVLSSGVLEHVPMDYESLKEIYRVLKPDGLFLVTFLPNRYSYTECAARILQQLFPRREGSRGHRRLYRRRVFAETLKHYGFLPLRTGYHQFIPTQEFPRLFRRLWPLNGPLERLWPTRLLCANVWAVARKRQSL
jgi:SAM-dependent methyltransferase